MKKILIVEDDVNYLEILFNQIADNISDNAKITKICTDGESALTYIQNMDVDIVILDLNIPKIDGITILEKIKQKNMNTKVIVISGESDRVLEIIKKNINVNQILIKPFQLNKLIDSINDIALDLHAIEDKNKVLNLISEFNFNKSNIGYKYILDCLELCIKREYKSISCMKNLYMDISKRYNGVSIQNISWNIYKCIQVMNKLTSDTTMKKYFMYDSKPSPKSFINEILNLYYTS